MGEVARCSVLFEYQHAKPKKVEASKDQFHRPVIPSSPVSAARKVERQLAIPICTSKASSPHSSAPLPSSEPSHTPKRSTSTTSTSAPQRSHCATTPWRKTSPFPTVVSPPQIHPTRKGTTRCTPAPTPNRARPKEPTSGSRLTPQGNPTRVSPPSAREVPPRSTSPPRGATRPPSA